MSAGRREDALLRAAREEAARARRARRDPEPSLGARLGHIGLLGWMIVMPVLAGVWIGRQLDRALGTGVMLSGALVMLGAALGLWFAWRWMNAR